MTAPDTTPIPKIISKFLISSIKISSLEFSHIILTDPNILFSNSLVQLLNSQGVIEDAVRIVDLKIE
jgi:hypothetical protein